MTGGTGSTAVSCIVPLGADEPELATLLEALRNQTDPPAEIIIADDRRHGAPPLDLPRVTLLRTPGRAGPAAARNLGAAAANGTWLLFIDSDCLPPAGWAETLLAPLRAGQAEASFGRYSGTRSSSLLALAQHVTMDREKRRLAENPRVLSTSNMAIRAETFRDAGGFPDLRFHEDDVFGFRFSARFRIRFVPQAAVAHRFHESWGGFFRQQYDWASGMILAYAVEPGLLTAGQSFGKGRILLRLAAIGGVLLALLLLPWLPVPAFLLLLATGSAWTVSVRGEARSCREDTPESLPWFRFHAVREGAWLAGLCRGCILHGPRLLKAWISR